MEADSEARPGLCPGRTTPCPDSESVRSKTPPLHFSEETIWKKPKPKGHRPSAPCPDSESVRSKTPPLHFSEETTWKKAKPERHRRNAPFPDSESVRSKTPPLHFSEETIWTKVKPKGHRPSAPGPDSESVRSKTPPLHFSEETTSTSKRPSAVGPSSESVRSKSPPLQFSDETASTTSRSTPSGISLRSMTPPLQFPLKAGAAPEKYHLVSSVWGSEDEDDGADDGADAFAAAQKKHKESMRSRCKAVNEGIEGTGETASLTKIYTELYITEKQRDDERHEFRRLEAGFKKVVQETAIRCHDIFKALPSDRKNVSLVLTSGVAGVGKTFSVLKFCLDWSQGSENQELELVVPMSFRELNLTREGCYSLLELVHMFHPSLEALTAHSVSNRRLLFIFDGLDESRLELDFNCELIHDVTQKSKVKTLLVNLIRGNLLPDALIWITSRPAAAANQVLTTCVDRLTEVRGFTDKQKDEYFTRKFSDRKRRRTVLRHVKVSPSLHAMCQVPIFCWITSTVLNHILENNVSGPLPQTLTDMYAHFLLVQTYRKRKYGSGGGAMELTHSDCALLLKLGKLAFEHLQSGNIMFYQEDLEQVGVNLTDATVNSGLCTEILKEESVLFHRSVYCFVHLSVQEFLAAVYMLHSFNHSHTEQVQQFLTQDWEENLPLDVFLKMSLEKSFENQSGRLDLFVRFLHGLSQESNQTLLRSLLGPARTDAQTTQKIVQNLKERNTGRISANGSITVYCCLSEMNDHSVHQQIMEVLRAEFGVQEMSQFHCGSLAQKLQMPREVLDELDIKRFSRGADGKLRLVPPNTCREATILWNGLLKEHVEVVASALKSRSSELRHLNLWLRDAEAVEALCPGLRHSNCKLETLSLHHSRLSAVSCGALASALKSNCVHLKKLDVSWNEELQDSGVERLCELLQTPTCQLDSLRLENCKLGKDSCSSLASALITNPTLLKELDVTENELTDAGVEHFCVALQAPGLTLRHLRLDNCGLTELSCSSLAAALRPLTASNLKKLDLSVNEVKDSGVELLCEYLRSPNCRLEEMELKACDLTERACAALASALNSHMKDLRLNWNEKMKDRGVEHMSEFIKSPRCGLQDLRFRGCGVTGSGCLSLALALESASSCPIRDLDLCENNLTQSDVEKLTELLLSQKHKLEKLEWEEN